MKRNSMRGPLIIWLMTAALFLVTAVCAMAQSAPELMGKDGGLSWDAVTDSDLAGYRVYLGAASGQYGSPKDVGNVTQVSRADLGLSDGVYFAAVTATDQAGNESGFSNEVNFRVDQTPPQNPGGLKTILKITITIDVQGAP